MRTVLFTGKGGVGKTTVASATAIACAQAGLSTAIMSTDPAHSLSDCFGVELDAQLTEVHPKCWATELDATDRLEERWGDVRDWLRSLFDWAGLSDVEAEELAVLPGLEELFALTDIRAFAHSDDFDVLIVDCAPTAETIRLLSLPDIISWYMKRLFPASRRFSRLVGPVVGRMTQLPIAGDEVFASFDRMYQELDEVRGILRDRDHSSVRLVVNAEKMVVAEARRTFTYLSLFGYRVDAVVANRLLPDAMRDPWFDQWRAIQAEQLEAIEAGFAPVPVLRADLAADEISGPDSLGEFAAGLYGDRDPAAVLFVGEPFRVEGAGAGRELVIELPFVERHELDLSQVDGELLVRVGPYRRNIVLPDSLRRRTVAGASLVDGTVRVRFH